MKILLIACVASVSWLPLQVSAAGAVAAENSALDRIIRVRAKPGAPARFQMIVNAGSTDEEGGVSRGLAHYIEHLVLNGRNPLNGDVAMRFFPDGSSNGRTSQIGTVYVHSFPPEKYGLADAFDKLFQFYAGQLRKADYQPEMAARERNVVLQEHDWRYADKPIVTFARRMDRALYGKHPYADWTIGTRKSIQSLQIEDAKRFHARWYHINNVWFVIQSELNIGQLRQIAAKHLAGLKPAQLPAQARLAAPDTAAARVQLAHKDKKVKQAQVFFRKLISFPGQNAERGFATALVLRRILGTQLPGSLYDEIVERQELSIDAPGMIVRQVTGSTYLLSISATPASGVPAAKVLAAIEQYAGALGKPGYSDRTIKRIKTRLLAAYRRRAGNSDSYYRGLVSWLAAGRAYRQFDQLPDRVEETGRAELDRLAAALAGPGRVVAGILSPEPAGTGKPGDSAPLTATDAPAGNPQAGKAKGRANP